MRRKITVTLIIIVCFLLQSTLFKALSFASISPNLLIVVCASFGFMRGRKEGIFIGFFSGLLIDIFFGEMIGFYALLYMYVGFLNGCFKKMFYPDDIKLPMLLIAGSDYLIICLSTFSGFYSASSLQLDIICYTLSYRNLYTRF